MNKDQTVGLTGHKIYLRRAATVDICLRFCQGSHSPHTSLPIWPLVYLIKSLVFSMGDLGVRVGFGVKHEFWTLLLHVLSPVIALSFNHSSTRAMG